MTGEIISNQWGKPLISGITVLHCLMFSVLKTALFTYFSIYICSRWEIKLISYYFIWVGRRISCFIIYLLFISFHTNMSSMKVEDFSVWFHDDSLRPGTVPTYSRDTINICWMINVYLLNKPSFISSMSLKLNIGYHSIFSNYITNMTFFWLFYSLVLPSSSVTMTCFHILSVTYFV